MTVHSALKKASWSQDKPSCLLDMDSKVGMWSNLGQWDIRRIWYYLLGKLFLAYKNPHELSFNLKGRNICYGKTQGVSVLGTMKPWEQKPQEPRSLMTSLSHWIPETHNPLCLDLLTWHNQFFVSEPVQVLIPCNWKDSKCPIFSLRTLPPPFFFNLLIFGCAGSSLLCGLSYSCGKQGLLPVSLWGLFIAVASLVAEHRHQQLWALQLP